MPLDSTNFAPLAPPTPLEISETTDPALLKLYKMRELLARPSGWCQGKVRRGDAYCISGAQFAVDPHMTAFVGQLLNQALPNSDRCWGRIAYNDTPGRTQAEILAVIDRAIELRLRELHSTRA